MSSFARAVASSMILFGALSPGFAASPAIGLAIANGSFQVDHAKVWGNTTVFDGNVIETNVSSSAVQLNGGASVQLAAESRGRVYESRLVLERGIGQLDSENYRIEAAGLQIAPDKRGAMARVQLAGPNRVLVAAREGTVRVSNRDGVLVARLTKGREMVFEPQASDAAPTKVSGILALKDGKFILVDRVTNVTMQLQGSGLEAQVGNLVEITGTVASTAPTVAGASQVIDVTGVKRLVKGEREADAATAGAAGGAAAGAAAGGISTGATVAIIGGVAAAGTIGGLAAAHALPGQGGNPPPTSR